MTATPITPRPRPLALVLVWAFVWAVGTGLLAGTGSARAQTAEPQGLGAPVAASATAAACPGAGDDIDALHLYGLWQLRLWPDGGSEHDATSRGAVLLYKHPEYAGSVRGDLRRAQGGEDLSARVSGDMHEGEFQLDESADGTTMSAVWSGVPEDCGRSIRGTRRPAEGLPGNEPALNFRLLRQSGWQ